MANQKGNQQQTNTGSSEQSPQAKRIEGKVADIFNEREVVLNIGSDAGVKPEMKFEILDTEGRKIIDPDTGETLGTLDRVKIRVEAVDIQHKMCVARTYETRRVNVGGSGLGWQLGGIFAQMGPAKWETRVRTLRFDQEERFSELSVEESIVKIGDRVRQVFEP